MPRYLQRCGAGVKHDEVAVFNEFGCLLADARFLLEVEQPLGVDSGVLVLVLNGLAHSATARANEEVSVLEDGQILADRYFGDAGVLTELSYQHFVFLFQQLQNQRPAFLC